MNPDITRDTFDREKHFARVLLQQGRVMLDADGNEQTAILLHLIRTLARDVFGEHGGPDADHSGFLIQPTANPKDFKISPGRYYVDGILCENEPAGPWKPGTEPGCTYLNQPYYGPEEAAFPGRFTVYLDVWERPVGYLEDGSLREVALGGPDTALRSEVVWQVRFIEDDPAQDALVEALQPEHRGLLRARVAPSDASTEPCIISPESRYRGAENQLYRVEVHAEGESGEATFKWSRDNGSVCFALRSLGNEVARLESLGPDSRRTLKVGDWVEVVDQLIVQRGEPCPLALVTDVQPDDVSVKLEARGALPKLDPDRSTPLLRRWDYQEEDDPASGRPLLADDGALLIQEGRWWTLEDGVQIQFVAPPVGKANYYRTGDYWLIPARVATGNVEWPVDPKVDDPAKPEHYVARGPHGVWHHYARLAFYDGAAFQPLRQFLRP